MKSHLSKLRGGERNSKGSSLPQGQRSSFWTASPLFFPESCEWEIKQRLSLCRRRSWSVFKIWWTLGLSRWEAVKSKSLQSLFKWITNHVNYWHFCLALFLFLIFGQSQTSWVSCFQSLCYTKIILLLVASYQTQEWYWSVLSNQLSAREKISSLQGQSNQPFDDFLKTNQLISTMQSIHCVSWHTTNTHAGDSSWDHSLLNFIQQNDQ